MAAFYYVLKTKLIKENKENEEIDFLEFEKKFENENPIIAREEAFRAYQNYIDVLLEAKGKTYISDNQAREDLSTFIDPKEKLTFGDKEVMFKDSWGNGIGVFLCYWKKNTWRSLTPKSKNGKIITVSPFLKEEIFILGIGYIDYHSINLNFLIYGLEQELELYNKNEYDTLDLKTEILFCDQDEWEEGYLGNDEWEDSYEEPHLTYILKTPFDWTGYDKPYWWGEPNKEETSENDDNPVYLEDLIENGETNQVEFKPSLLYNFAKKKGGIGIKGIIAKTICAFLNSKGGHLLIGIKDNGEPQGLSYDYSLSDKENKQDFFRLEFDQMLEYFLSFSVKDNVTGQFLNYQDYEIFVVSVFPIKRNPVFLNGRNGKEFYVRGEASSRQITDPEELVNYCLERWSPE